MSAKSRDKYETFQSQNPDNEYFDVIFIMKENKRLYANKYMLTSTSVGIKSLIDQTWTAKNEPIDLSDYSYDDFYQFLTFLYTDECQLTENNIFAMVDISKIYGGPSFQNYIHNYFSNNLLNILKSEHFQSLRKSTLKFIVESHQKNPRQEELFEAVYKCAENSVRLTGQTDDKIVKEKIKDELSDILQFFNLFWLDDKSFVDLLGKYNYVFPSNYLFQYYKTERKFVKITDENGKVMKGELLYDENPVLVDIIKSLKDTRCDRFISHARHQYYYWMVDEGSSPITPSKLIKNENVEWYLIFVDEGDIAMKRRNELQENDYLLAEMYAEDGFQPGYGCNIEML